MNARKGAGARRAWFTVGAIALVALIVAGVVAPENLPQPDLALKYANPAEVPPLGADELGRSFLAYALQGASIVIGPAMVAGAIVAFFSAVAGLARCAGLSWFDTVLQVFSEVMGALPRMVVILVVALAMPKEWASLYPIAVAWAFLAAPAAMDEAASAAGRLGGARFVEALRAHGFSAFRVYLYHITWLNLRAVLTRQAAEVLMQVVFLEIALSYLVQVPPVQPDLTHSADVNSWAAILYRGFQTAAGGEWFGDRSMLHALILGLVLVALVALMAQAFRVSARQR